MRNKKVISILLVTILGLTLVACGEDKENKTTNESSVQTSEENQSDDKNVDDNKEQEEIVEGIEDHKTLEFQRTECDTHVKRNNPAMELREGNFAAWVEGKDANGVKDGYSTVYTTFYKNDVNGTTKAVYTQGKNENNAIIDIKFVRYEDGFPSLAIIIGDGKKTGDAYLLRPQGSVAYRAYKCGTRERVNKIIDKENGVMELEIYKYKDNTYTDYDIVKKDINVYRPEQLNFKDKSNW